MKYRSRSWSKGRSNEPLDTLVNYSLQTLAEQSGFTQTGRIDEVDRLCATMAATWPEAVRTFEYGRSAEGRPLRALIASRSCALSPQELHARRIPILMIQAGIHPGESDVIPLHGAPVSCKTVPLATLIQ